MGTSILNIGASGLRAAQAGLLTTGHNISNAATPGFNRQQIVQSTNIPQFTGSGFFGQGTNVQKVERIYSQFLAAEVSAANTQVAELNTYDAQISQIDNLLADPSVGLTPALSDFFEAVQDAAANPASIPGRQSMLSSAEALVSRFQSLDHRMAELRDGVNSQLVGTIAEINSIAAQITDLNQRIVVAQGAGINQPANDLLDQRDQLLADLAKQIRITTTTNGDGSINVFVGNGQALVVGMQSASLTATAAADDPSQVQVGMRAPDGSAVALQESLITGGALGGLLAFRRETLDPAQNALGRVAMGFAATFNAQHRLGQDLDGRLGGDLFTPLAGTAIGHSNNAPGSAVAVAIIDIAQLTDSDYRLSYDGTAYTLMRLSDNVTWAAASLSGAANALAESAAQGFSLTGTLVAGDSFLIRPTRNGARDIGTVIGNPRSLALAGPLRTGAGTQNAGTATISAGSLTSVAGLAQTSPHAGAVTLTYNPASGGFDISGSVSGWLPYDPATDAAGRTFALAGIGDISFAISGVPQPGDTFTIASNVAGVADNRNALALGQLQSAQVMVGGGASVQSAYSQLVSSVGNRARQVQVNLTAQETLAKHAQDAMQSLSGVNLDEEAANIVRYQQAYQASAKMIEVAARLFDELLGVLR